MGYQSKQAKHDRWVAQKREECEVRIAALEAQLAAVREFREQIRTNQLCAGTLMQCRSTLLWSLTPHWLHQKWRRTMGKHTPGPWQLYRASHRDHAGAEDAIMPRTYDSATDRRDWPYRVASVACVSPSADANARLIAAAPDLLAACEAAEQTIQNYRDGEMAANQYVKPVLNQLRDGIAKATGESTNG